MRSTLNATELRIGNVISMGGNTIDTYQSYKNVRLTLPMLEAIQNENIERPGAMLSTFYAISLTPEILEKCGFIESLTQLGTVYSNGTFSFYGTENESEYVVALGIDVYFKYLHQLQNLYLALTGEELDVSKLFA